MEEITKVEIDKVLGTDDHWQKALLGSFSEIVAGVERIVLRNSAGWASETPYGGFVITGDRGVIFAVDGRKMFVPWQGVGRIESIG